MNIPYDVFYKAETTNNDVKVDALLQPQRIRHVQVPLQEVPTM